MLTYICWIVDGCFNAVAVYLVEAADILTASAIAMDQADNDGVDYEFGELPEPATQADIDSADKIIGRPDAQDAYEQMLDNAGAMNMADLERIQNRLTADYAADGCLNRQEGW